MTMTGGGGLVSAAPGTNTVHIKGAKVPGNESSTERKFHRTFVPGSEKAWERKGQGAKVTGSEARERKGQGAKGPRSESSRERIGQGYIGRFAPGRELARERKGWVPWLVTYQNKCPASGIDFLVYIFAAESINVSPITFT